jgi:hypothetical protein
MRTPELPPGYSVESGAEGPPKTAGFVIPNTMLLTDVYSPYYYRKQSISEPVLYKLRAYSGGGQEAMPCCSAAAL